MNKHRTPAEKTNRRPPRRALLPLLMLITLAGVAMVVTLLMQQGQGEKKPPTREEKPPLDPRSALLAELVREGYLRGDRPAWQPGPWEPTSAADQVVDRYVKAAQNAGRNELLGGKALAEGEVVNEADFEARVVDTLLHQPLTITGIWPGEPDDRGRQKPTPGRYTLQVKGALNVPKVEVREGNKQTPTSMSVTNPELVVVVQDGKLFGVRTSLPR